MWGQFWRLLRSCNKISLNTPQWPQGWLSPMSCGKLTHSDHEGAQLLWCYYSWENKKTICRNFIGAINKFSVELFSRECWGHTRPSVPRWNVQHGKLLTGVGFLCSKRNNVGGLLEPQKPRRDVTATWPDFKSFHSPRPAFGGCHSSNAWQKFGWTSWATKRCLCKS